MIMERSLEIKSGRPPASSPVSVSSLAFNTVSELGLASQDITPVPAMALVATTSELAAPSNCPNCKLLKRHLRVSREWNNFFRLKLDQKDMLLHVAANYKRQKQRCLQLQMSLDQQTRECGEMREQLTNLLLEVNPLRDRLQVAEKRAEEEVKLREKVEADTYNLRFVVEQQEHKIKDFETKFKSSLVETLERKLSCLRTEIKKLKQVDTQKSRMEWELKEEASFARGLELRALKKAHWGFTLAGKYGRRLLSLDQLPKKESSQEWSCLQNMLEKVENILHQQYLAFCKRVPVRPMKEVWLNDFHEKEFNEGEGMEENSGAKQLERLIQGCSKEKTFAEEIDEEGIQKEQKKRAREKFEEMKSQQSCAEPYITSRHKEASSFGNEVEPKNNGVSSPGQGNAITTSIMDTSTEDIDSESLSRFQNGIEEVAPHTLVDTGIEKKIQEHINSTSMLDTSMVNSDEEALPQPQTTVHEIAACSFGMRHALKEQKKRAGEKFEEMKSQQSCAEPYITSRHKEASSFGNEVEPKNNGVSSPGQGNAITTSIMDTSTEYSDSESFPRLENGVEEVAPNVVDSEIRTNTQELIKSTSILDTSTEYSDSKSLSTFQNGIEEVAPHTLDTGIKNVTQEHINSTSMMDTLENSDEEALPRPQTTVHEVAACSFDIETNGTEELLKSTTPLDDKIIDGHSDSSTRIGKGVFPVNSYDLDEELKAILQKMKPHEKLESMDTSFSKGASTLGEVDIHIPDMKQNFLGSLSDSEEEKGEREVHGQVAEDEAETCLVPRVLTTQISVGFSVAKSPKDNSLLDDLDISLDALDPEDEKEEKDIEKRVPLPHFQSSQSFSFDVEECYPLLSSHQNCSLMSEKEGVSEDQNKLCQSQLSQSMDKDGNTIHGHHTNISRPQNKVLLKELRNRFGAVYDTTTLRERETVDGDHYTADRTVENKSSEVAEGNIPVKVSQVGQILPKIPIYIEVPIEGGIFCIDQEIEVVKDAKSIALQEENSKEEEEKSTEAEGEQNDAALEGKTVEVLENIIVEVEEERTQRAVIDRTTEKVDITLTARVEKTTEDEEGRAIEIQEKMVEVKSTETEDRTTITVDKRIIEVKERITQTEQEKTPDVKENISKAEEGKNIKVDEIRTTKVNEQRITGAKEGRSKEDEETTTELEERTTKPKKERTTKAEEKSTKTGEERVTEVEEERSTGVEEERITETKKDGVIEAENMYAEAEEKRSPEINDDKTKHDEEETVTEISKERTKKAEEERNAIKIGGRNSPTMKRRVQWRISETLKEARNQEDEDEAKEVMERSCQEKRLRKHGKNNHESGGETQKGNERKLRQCVQRQQKMEMEKLEGEKLKGKKVELEKIINEKMKERIQNEELRRQKNGDQKNEQGENTKREEQAKKRYIKRNRRKQEEQEERGIQEKEKMDKEIEENRKRKQEIKENEMKKGDETRREKSEMKERKEEEEKKQEKYRKKKEEKKRMQDEEKQKRGMEKAREEEEESMEQDEKERERKEEKDREIQDADITMKEEEEKKKIREEDDRKKRKLEERKTEIQEEVEERQEHKRRKKENDELRTSEEEQQYRLKFKEMEEKGSEKEFNEKENQKKMSEASRSNRKENISMRQNDTKVTQKIVIGQSHFAHISKRQEKIVFSWGLKRKQWRKFTKFHKWGRFTKDLPDPFGSRHHSVFTRECRIQRMEQGQVYRNGVKARQSGRDLSIGMPEVQIICNKEREEEKENSVGKTKNLVMGISAEKLKKSLIRQNSKGSKRKHLGQEDIFKSEKAIEIGSRRRIRKKRRSSSSRSSRSSSRSKSSSRSRSSSRSSSSSSSRSRSRSRSSSRSDSRSRFLNEKKTVCPFPKEPGSRDRASQETIASLKNETISSFTRISNLSKHAKLHNSRASKVDLFGSDSDSSGNLEVEAKKKQLKKSRNYVKKEQQQPPGMIYNKIKTFRSSLPFATTVDGRKSYNAPVQSHCTRVLSSNDSLFSTSETTEDSEEELLDQGGQNSLSQRLEPLTSNLDVAPHRPTNRKCRSMLIESESEDPQGDIDSVVYPRKMRRGMVDDTGSGSQERDASNDNHHSQQKERGYSASSSLVPDLRNTSRMTQDRKETKGDVESSAGRYLTPSTSTRAIIPHTMKRRSSETQILLPRKHKSGAEGRIEAALEKCGKQHSSPPKHQKEPSVLQGDQRALSTLKSQTSIQSICGGGKWTVDCVRVDCDQEIKIKKIKILQQIEQSSTECKNAITPPLTRSRNHDTLDLQNPPYSSKRWKGSRMSQHMTFRHVRQHEINDSSGVSGNIGGVDKEDCPKDTSVLSQIDNDASLLSQSGDEALAIPQSESDSQTNALAQSESESGGELEIEEELTTCVEAKMQDTSKSYENTPQTHKAAVKRSQEGQVLRISHLGPVALFDRPRFIQKSVLPPKVTVMQTSVPAGPEYIDKLFSRLNQRTEKNSSKSTQDNYAPQTQGTRNSQAGGASIPRQPYPNQPARGIDYQDQTPVLLPNMYGTLRPASTIEKPKPSSSPSLIHCKPDHPAKTSRPVMPSSCYTSSSTEKIQPHPIPDQSHPTSDQSHLMPAQPHMSNTFHVSTAQLYPIQSQHPQCADSSLSEINLQHLPWLPDINPERVMHHSKQQKEKNLAIDELEEKLEEVVASRIQSKWWVMGLEQICVSITNTTLPSFLRFVIKSILRSDPLEPRRQLEGLPPRLYRLFQVVCIVEQRLAPQHPHCLRSALLRAIQAIITMQDITLTPYSLASLTAWYIASTSIEDHSKAGQKWMKAETFLVDLLFHHPGTIHLALLTVARTSHRLFCRLMQHRVTSGLGQVIVWLTHYGMWVGQPNVRSDLTKWLAKHLSLRTPPQRPKIFAKNVIALLATEKDEDWLWEAVVGLVVLVRWQGRPWARHHLLPALRTAMDKITNSPSLSSSDRRNSQQNENIKMKISRLFGNLGRALPCRLEDKESGDVVKEIEDAVILFCLSPNSECDLSITQVTSVQL